MSSEKWVSLSKCPGGWKIKEEVGKGAFGKTYQACCENKCDYVMKIQRSFTFQEKEIKIQIEASKIGIAPEIIDYKLGDDNDENDYSTVIMKSLDMTLEQFFKKFTSTGLFDDERVRGEVIIDCFSLIKKLHEVGYSHSDIHPNNIMITYKKEINLESILDSYERYKKMDVKYYLIDFGKSNISNPVEIKLDMRYIVFMFDHLFKGKNLEWFKEKKECLLLAIGKTF